MQTRVFEVSPDAPDNDSIQQAAEILQDGGLVAFPTETVYGLGANALDAQAVARIYEAKGRASNNPLIVHVSDIDAAQGLVAAWPDTAQKLAERFWPGPLTLVLPRKSHIPDIVTGGGPTVGVRVPAHPVALALLRASGLPLAAPSANRSLQLSPTRAAHVLMGLDGRIDALLDGGPTRGGLESTVLDLTTKRPTLLRPGLVSPVEIEAIIGPISRRPAAAKDADAPLPAPGMLSRHYAPRAPLEIMARSSSRVETLLAEGHVVGHLTADLPPGDPLGDAQRRLETGLAGLAAFQHLHVVRMPTDPAAYAAILYDRLHDLDALGVTRILVDALPQSEVWLAIRDRLSRAAVHAEDNEQ